MNPTRLMTMPCTLVHVTQDGPPDDYGNPTEQTTETESVCWIGAPTRLRAVGEDTGLANTQREEYPLYLPPEQEVDGLARAEVAGKTYELAGPPWHAFHPRLRRYTHWEAIVVRTV